MNVIVAIPEPLRIDEVKVIPYGGVIGIALCPGHSGRPDLIDRNLHDDLNSIRAWGADVVLTLMETSEFSAIGVPELPRSMQKLGIPWYHLPICDTKIPDAQFEQSWRTIGPEIIDKLKSNAKIFIHCRGGLGRSGTIAARILVEIGQSPKSAIETVRNSRPGAIENCVQEEFVLSLDRPT